MTPVLALAIAILGALSSALLALILFVLHGIRDDLGRLGRRVGEHDSFIAAYKLQHHGG